jgi:hypothetical protein
MTDRVICTAKEIESHLHEQSETWPMATDGHNLHVHYQRIALPRPMHSAPNYAIPRPAGLRVAKLMQVIPVI